MTPLPYCTPPTQTLAANSFSRATAVTSCITAISAERYVNKANDAHEKDQTERRVKLIRTHDLRHTHAGMRIADGVDIMTLSRDLGHSDPGFTLRIYGHIFERYRPREAASLTKLLGIEDSAATFETLLHEPDTFANFET